MAATEKLGLTLIEPSDFISPTPINQNFQKVDALGVDYIVEQGTSGEWWYRKWNSGRAECGVDDKNFGSKVLNKTSNANFYKTDFCDFGAFPLTFSKTPGIFITSKGDAAREDAGSTILIIAWTNSTTRPPKFRCVDWSAGTLKVYASIYVTGQWK